jgi:phosphoenolpyruvate-protein kinase (PTS system EI component)
LARRCWRAGRDRTVDDAARYPAVKARIRASTMGELQALAARALAAHTAADVRALNSGEL